MCLYAIDRHKIVESPCKQFNYLSTKGTMLNNVSAPEELCCAACSHTRHLGNQEMGKKNRRSETAASPRLAAIRKHQKLKNKLMKLGLHSQQLGEGWCHPHSTGVSNSWILGFSTELWMQTRQTVLVATNVVFPQEGSCK